MVTLHTSSALWLMMCLLLHKPEQQYSAIVSGILEGMDVALNVITNYVSVPKEAARSPAYIYNQIMIILTRKHESHIAIHIRAYPFIMTVKDFFFCSCEKLCSLCVQEHLGLWEFWYSVNFCFVLNL
jgi:hypothetical protein